MPLNIFKKNKGKTGKEEIKKESKKPSETVAKKESRKKEIKNQAFRVLRAPHITEKATDLTQNNQYIFRVFSTANKTEIKKEIKNVYGVDAISVRIINVPAKKRRLGKISGWRQGYKKAVVRIKEGQKIEVLPR